MLYIIIIVGYFVIGFLSSRVYIGKEVKNLSVKEAHNVSVYDCSQRDEILCNAAFIIFMWPLAILYTITFVSVRKLLNRWFDSSMGES